MKDYYSMFKSLDRLDGSLKQRQDRGRKFEKLVIDYFSETGSVIKNSYRTSDNKSEQIDGAIEIKNRIFLMEIKWVESGLAASDLYSFQGKVDNKFAGTLGLFISKEELSQNFINALNKGRRQSVIVLHGEDIELLFKENISICDYIEYAIEELSVNSIQYIPMQQFIKSTELQNITKKQKNTKKGKLVNLILSTTDKTKEIFALIKPNFSDNDKIFVYVLNNFSEIMNVASKSNEETIIRENLTSFIYHYLCSSTHQEKFIEQYFSLYISSNYDSFYDDVDLLELFTDNYFKLSMETKLLIEKAILTYIDNNFGKYYHENYITFLVEKLWNKFSKESLEQLFHRYLEIYVSDRYDNFPQKSFANRLVEYESFENKEKQLKNWLVKKYEYYKEIEDNSPEEFRSDPIKLLINETKDIMKVLNIDSKKQYKDFLLSLL